MRNTILSFSLAEGRKEGNEALGVNEMISLMFLRGNKPGVRVLLPRCTQLRSQTFAFNPFSGHWLGGFMRLSLGQASQQTLAKGLRAEHEAPEVASSAAASWALNRSQRVCVVHPHSCSCPTRWGLGHTRLSSLMFTHGCWRMYMKEVRGISARCGEVLLVLAALAFHPLL